MDDALVVRRFDGVGDLTCNPQRFVDRQCTARLIGQTALDDVGERVTIDELENEVLNAVGFFETVDGADVGMIHRGEHPRLALEPRETIRGAREGARQDFDGDIPAQLRVARAIHFAHATGAE